MSYIGTPTSRIDGHAKVTGAAKYAGELNVDGLAYAAVVTSTIAKGRIARIDVSEALRVEGVLDMLTHENRPPMARSTSAYKDDVAPEQGSPFRPLYDDKILFSGQPIALVLAEEWEIARFAASLVRVDYKPEPFATDLFAERGKAVDASRSRRSRAARPTRPSRLQPVRHEAEYFIPIEHHNPMELYASTAIWEGGGKLTVYDKTQGVQNVQRYLCGIFNMKPDDMRVCRPLWAAHSAPGLRPQYQVVLAVLGARALQRSVRLVLTRQQMYGLGYRPAIHRAACARREARTERSTRSRTRRSRSRRATKTFPATTPAGRACSTKARTRNMRIDWRGSTCRPRPTCGRRARRPASTRSNARWTSSRSRSSSTRSSCGCAAIRTATSTTTFPTPARSCANATGRARKPSAGTSATRSRAPCATAASWSAGAWRPASGRRCRCRPPPASC